MAARRACAWMRIKRYSAVMAKTATRTGSSGLVAGIDLGGTNMSIGIVDSDHRIIGRCKKKTMVIEGSDAIIDRICDGVEKACEDAGIKVKDLDAVGIGAPGAIDHSRGVVLIAPNLHWHDMPLRKRLESKLSRPIIVDNDVNVAAWGESRMGCASGRGDLLAVWIGTGIGGGLVLDGSLYRGEFFTAGEIGHTVISPGGPPSARTVEQICSRSGMSHSVRRLLPLYPDSALHHLIDHDRPDGKIGSKVYADAYKARDPLAIEIIEHAAELLGIAIANWITVLSIDTVVLGGGMTESMGSDWVKLVRKSFDANVQPIELRKCKLLETELKDTAGLLGAALLAADEVHA